jgi:hypothetical protein
LPQEQFQRWNINRQHLSKGQLAILIDKARLLDSNKSAKALAKESGLSQPHLSQAGTILKYAPDLAEAILAENGKFDPAASRSKSPILKSIPSKSLWKLSSTC